MGITMGYLSWELELLAATSAEVRMNSRYELGDVFRCRNRSNFIRYLRANSQGGNMCNTDSVYKNRLFIYIQLP